MSVELLRGIQPHAMVEWIKAVPRDKWPQQDRMTAESPYPAIVTDLGWCGFGAMLGPVVAVPMQNFDGCHTRNHYLSRLEPGQCVETHTDIFGPDWVARVHVPLLTNPDAKMIFDDLETHMAYGWAYKVDVRLPHSIVNRGKFPRIHFFFDVWQGAEYA